jgi:hypothetical protein
MRNIKEEVMRNYSVCIDNPSVYRRDDGSGDLPKDLELDFNKLETEVIAINQFIRGILKIPTVNNQTVKFLKMDKIYSFSKYNEFIERYREEDELTGHIIYGRFQYTKSLNYIDLFGFNKNIGLPNMYREKLLNICSEIINNEKLKQKKSV